MVDLLELGELIKKTQDNIDEQRKLIKELRLILGDTEETEQNHKEV